MFSRAIVVSARSLLDEAIAHVPARVGWPDDDVLLRVRSPDILRAAFVECLTKFRAFWSNTPTVIDIGLNTVQRKLDVRVKQLAVEPERSSTNNFPESLKEPFSMLDRIVGAAKGKTYYWGTNNYFGMMLPVQVWSGQPQREDFPRLKTKDWDELYRLELARTSWEELRGKAFRFCNHTTQFVRALKDGETTVLVPSVGLCAHPWIFAEAGLRVIATDIASTALETLSQPECWPRIYGSAAQERWDIQQVCLYGGVANPAAFPPMAAIERAEVATNLRSRIRFVQADWTALPLDTHSIDLVFSTNALPREDNDLMARVVAEWQRVLKPNGHLFLAMHNAGVGDIMKTFERVGWTAVESFDANSTQLTYQHYFSSG